MKDMKAFQEALNDEVGSSGIPTKVVLQYPPSMQLEVGFNKINQNRNGTDRYSFGSYLNYAMTRGRLHYQDYSGEVFGNQILRRIVLGGNASAFVSRRLEFYAKIGLNYSMMKIDFSSSINGVGSDSNSSDFHSVGLNLEPGMCLSFPLKRIVISVNTGYEFNVQGTTWLDTNDEVYLVNENGDQVIVDWSGLRLGLSLGYKLGG